MATWTPIGSTNISWTGKIITTTMWNQYFGANGNMQYIKETYERYYVSLANTVSIPNNVTTIMNTYTIPVGWGNGLYFISMNVEPSAANELAANGRRVVVIGQNGGVAAGNNYVSVLSAGGIKPTYNITLYRRLQAGDVIDYRFYQLGTAANFVLRATIQKVGV